jgi:hypothetical protein
MRVYCVVALLPVLLVGADTPRPIAREELQEVLKAQEVRLLEAIRTRNAIALETFLAEDFVAIGADPSGRLSRMEFLKVLRDFRLDGYVAGNLHAMPAAADAVILTYQLRAPHRGEVWVSSVWARREGKWLAVLWQETPTTLTAARGSRDLFETNLTAESVRYRYQGSAALEDVHAAVRVMLERGAALELGDYYWGTWQPGQVKEISLAYLAAGATAVQRLELTVNATRDGRKVQFAATFRR